MGCSSAAIWRMRWAHTSSESARCAASWRMLHLPGAGVKSSSSPKTPVNTMASSSGPRRKRSRRSVILLIALVIIRATQIVAALRTHQLAFVLDQARGADRTVQHRFVVGLWLRRLHKLKAIIAVRDRGRALDTLFDEPSTFD